MKIMVVDDEKVLVKGITFNLRNEGYEVESAFDGKTAVSMARSGEFDLIILDLMMPEMDGLEACRRIREFSSVPIIMLTARSGDHEKLLGFEYGADDYITKPFNILELKSRVRAVLRRSAGDPAVAKKIPEITAGHITLNMAQRTAYKNGKSVDLTVKEFDTLEMLMKSPGTVFSREELLEAIWGYQYPGDIRTVDVHIRRLREKLENDDAEPEYILTKWGRGYYFKNETDS